MCTRARICTWGFHFAHLLTCSRRLCSDQNVVSAPERSYLSWRSTSRLLSTSVKALENDLLSSLLRSTWSGSVQSGFVMRNSTSFFSARASDVSVFYSLFCNTAVYFLAFCLRSMRHCSCAMRRSLSSRSSANLLTSKSSWREDLVPTSYSHTTLHSRYPCLSATCWIIIIMTFFI